MIRLCIIQSRTPSRAFQLWVSTFVQEQLRHGEIALHTSRVQRRHSMTRIQFRACIQQELYQFSISESDHAVENRVTGSIRFVDLSIMAEQ